MRMVNIVFSRVLYLILWYICENSSLTEPSAYKVFLWNYVCVCLCLCVGSLRGQKRASDPLGLELQEVGAGNSAQVLWKSCKCF